MKESVPSKLTNANDLTHLGSFIKRNGGNLAVVARPEINGCADFFSLLNPSEVKLATLVTKQNANDDIKKSLKGVIPAQLQQHSFYEAWVQDMANICHDFCALLDVEQIIFWLSSDRVCKKFHIDKTSFRLLVTYYGYGTEWTQHSLSEIKELNTNSNPNIEHINSWDIAIFRGGKNGIVHRSPQTPPNKYSILMRLDVPKFLPLKQSSPPSMTVL